MTKADFVEQVADRMGSSKTEAATAVDAVFDSIQSALVRGDDVTVTGFGTFSAAKRRSREGVNPRTGEKITIPAKIAPKFKAGKSLKDALN
jgi:DNA-binding protein HU-beta